MYPDKFIQLYRMSVASFDGLLGFRRSAIMRGSINLAEWLGLGYGALEVATPLRPARQRRTIRRPNDRRVFTRWINRSCKSAKAMLIHFLSGFVLFLVVLRREIKRAFCPLIEPGPRTITTTNV